MTPVARSIWYIESHLARELSLEEIARESGVSRFHLARAFNLVTGLSVMRYLRGRRLSEAALQLRGGAPDILSVALEAGYGSHEAFTRAFRDQFGLTPEAARAAGATAPLSLMEPFKMSTTTPAVLEPPRFEEGRPMLLAGLASRFDQATMPGIPLLWQRFNAWEGSIAGAVGPVAYGTCYNGDDTGSFDYMAGVEVSGFDDLPVEFARLRVPANRYAVFRHSGHVSGTPQTFHAIWNSWLPGSGYEVDDAPMFERYGPEFDGRTGLGGFEIWFPVKAKS